MIPHPVFPSDPERRDDGRTLLSLGIIREYKGIGDAIEATKRIDGARLLVAGDPLESIDGYRAAAGDRAEWRLGYPVRGRGRPRRSARRRSRSFPTGPRSTRAGRCSARSEPVFRSSPTTWAGLPSRCGASRRVGSCRRATSTRSRTPRASCSTTRRRLSTPAPVPSARRRELTWDAAARAHLELYRGAPVSFEDVIRRQLDLFEQECADLIADCDAAERAYDAAGPRRGRGAVRRLSGSRRDRHGAPGGASRRLRLHHERGRRRGVRGGVQRRRPAAATSFRPPDRGSLEGLA